MVIDSHMHLIRLKNFDKDIYQKVYGLPNETDLDQLVGWYKEAGISHVVCMGQDMRRLWNTSFGDEYVIEAYRRYPKLFIPFASLEPLERSNNFNQAAYDELERAIEEDHIRGVLMTPPYGQYKSNDKCAYPFYQLIQKKGIVLQYHHSAQMGPAIFAPTPYAKLENLNEVIIDFPDLKVVVEHLGYPWSEQLFVLMTNCPQMYTDLAMTYGRPRWMAWQLVLAREYGVLDRVMFASDYVSYSYDYFSDNPANDFKSWINVVRYGLNEINKQSGWPLLTDEEVDSILYRAAKKLYNL